MHLGNYQQWLLTLQKETTKHSNTYKGDLTNKQKKTKPEFDQASGSVSEDSCMCGYLNLNWNQLKLNKI